MNNKRLQTIRENVIGNLFGITSPLLKKGIDFIAPKIVDYISPEKPKRFPPLTPLYPSSESDGTRKPSSGFDKYPIRPLPRPNPAPTPESKPRPSPFPPGFPPRPLPNPAPSPEVPSDGSPKPQFIRPKPKDDPNYYRQ